MAEKKISNKELAELSGVHPTSISKLKNVDEIEQISGRVLNSLCNGLTKAYRGRGENLIITPADLFVYTYDGDVSVPSRSEEKPLERKTTPNQQLTGSNQGTKASAQIL
ncbi:hypothetical protein NUACC21_77320 [Scytonema sp. NUACC21]